MKYKVGDNVKWKVQGEGPSEGEIEERYIQEVTIEADGKNIQCNADADNPGYLIRTPNGKHVFKSQSELNRNQD